MNWGPWRHEPRFLEVTAMLALFLLSPRGMMQVQMCRAKVVPHSMSRLLLHTYFCAFTCCRDRTSAILRSPPKANTVVPKQKTGGPGAAPKAAAATPPSGSKGQSAACLTQVCIVRTQKGANMCQCVSYCVFYRKRSFIL